MNGHQKHKKSKSEQKQILFISLVYFLYLILNILPLSREITTNLSEVFYFIISLVVFSFIMKNNKKKLTAFFLFFIPAFFGIYLLQVVSVNNDALLGSQEFGSVFTHKIADVPFIVSLFWIVTIFSSLSLAAKLFKNNPLRIVMASLFTVMLDVFLEHVAMKLDYWQWENKVVPLSNYITWFIASLFLTTTILIIKIEPRSQVSRSFFIIQTVFFFLLWVFL